MKEKSLYAIISLNYIKIIITTLNSTEVEWEMISKLFSNLKFYDSMNV